MIDHEGVHPLEGGAFRLEVPARPPQRPASSNRRFVFYPRYGFEIVTKAWKYTQLLPEDAQGPEGGARGARPLDLQRPRHRAAARRRIRAAVALSRDHAAAKRRSRARRSATAFAARPPRRPDRGRTAAE